jgi:hypothetical protein
MAELRASPVVNPSYKRIADVLANLQGPMGEIIPFTDANPFKFLMPAASTFENLAYGNAPLAMPPGVTNRRLPIVKTGREGEFTDLASLGLLATGVPQVARGAMQGANYLGDVLTQATRAAPPAAPMRAVSEIAEAAPITPKPPPPEPVRSDIGFYSQLEAATNPLQDKGTGDQFLSQLQKSAGVKPDEIKYTGLDEFLKGKKAVTKAEIQGYLASNKVDVQEVRLGDLPFSEQAFNDRFTGRGFSMVQTDDGPQFTRTDMTGRRQLNYGELPEDIQATIENQYVPNTKYHLGALKNIDTEIPGGENYRELLLTLPDTKGARLDARRAEIQAKGINATDAEKQEWVSIMNQLQPETRDVEGLSPFRNRPEFRTIHFDQPNILAHMRVNDRTVDGKKTLFIEEIQSDWHQKGRKKGYGPQTETTHEAFYTTPDGQKVSLGFGKTQEEAAAAVDPNWKNLVDIKFDSQTVKVDEGVPDAPFKTSWHELTLKRAIQEASEKGYDQIAFTTGKTQVERYPEALRQVADDISWSNIDESGRKYVDIKKDGNIVLQVSVDQSGKIYQSSIQDAYGKTLDEFVGKPMAQRVTSESQGTIKGQDFTVGGKGMEGFYDNILPKSLEKLGKKFDAKVGKTEMDGVEVWQMDITPKMRESVTTKGQPLFAVPAAGLLGAGMSQDEQMF